MLQKTNNKLKGKKGFTLMEMLIVVAIIAILLAILIPAFSGALTDSKIKADQANVRAWYAEQMAAMMTSGAKPATFDKTKVKLQASATAVVKQEGDTPETFKVTYLSGIKKTVDTKEVDIGEITFSADGSTKAVS